MRTHARSAAVIAIGTVICTSGAIADAGTSTGPSAGSMVATSVLASHDANIVGGADAASSLAGIKGELASGSTVHLLASDGPVYVASFLNRSGTTTLAFPGEMDEVSGFSPRMPAAIVNKHYGKFEDAYVAGVVPDSVAVVTLTFNDGTSQSVNTKNDAFVFRYSGTRTVREVAGRDASGNTLFSGLQSEVGSQ